MPDAGELFNTKFPGHPAKGLIGGFAEGLKENFALRFE